MSRVAKKPVALPKGVELNIQADSISAKGPKGTLVDRQAGRHRPQGRRRHSPCSAPKMPRWCR